MEPVNRYLDAAVLVPEFTQDQAIHAIETSIQQQVFSVCVRPSDITLASARCKGTNTAVCAVLSFPHGHDLTPSKADAARRFVELGVDEIDMVANYGLALSGNWDRVRDDVAAVVDAAGILVKVILETAQLDTATIQQLVEICVDAKADFVKTSTGFHGGGATVEAVQTMLDAADGRIKVKASGGIRDRETAERYIAMGVARLGVGWTSCTAICGGDAPAAKSGY